MLPMQLQGEDACARDIARLEAILERDVAAGTVVLGHRGKINVKHYARELGYSAFIFENRGLLQVVERYQFEGGAETNLEVKLPAMRNWLQGRMKDGTLLIRNGKVDRKELCKVLA